MASLLPAALALVLAAQAEAGAEPAPAPGAEPPRRYLVERIDIEGLERTRPSEVRKYLKVSEGELLDDERVLRSRLRLLPLGWFARVETRVERGSKRGRVVLVFAVTERNTLVLTDLILGSTGPQPIYGGFGLSQQNFLGEGLMLSGAFVYGASPGDPASAQRFSLRGAFFEPDLRLAGLAPIVAGVTAIWIQGEEFTCADPTCSAYRGHYGAAPRIRYSRAGGELSLGVRPGSFERLVGGLRYERLGADLPAAGSIPSGAGVPFIRRGGSNLVALTGTYDRDTRSDVFFPTDGSRFLGQITFASRALGGDYDYSRYLVQAEVDVPLPGGHGLRLQGAAGAAQGDAPFFDRFYAADFAYFSIGPALGRALELNFSTDSRYDELLLVAGAEWGIPLWTSRGFWQRGYVALGARAVWSAQRPDAGRTTASSTPFSADVALRLETPIGLFNLSLGYAVDVLW